MHDSLMDVPIRAVRLGPIDVTVEQRVDGSMLLRLKEPLGPYPRRYTERLEHFAQSAPERALLARRPIGGPPTGAWERLTYGEAFRKVRAIGQALLDRGLSPERPVMILSENDFENKLLALAALHVGVPYIPVSPAYSLLSQDFAKLRQLNELCRPGLVFAANGKQYGGAATLAFPDAELVVTAQMPDDRPATPFAALVDTHATVAVDAAYERIQPETIGKILFTSGTTGSPKGVILSHRMLCSNRQQLVQTLPFLLDEPPVLVDWLPWHHTFGGTNNFGAALYCGGTLYIDPGKPMPEAIQPTVDALREVAPTIYYNTPQGFSSLLPHLRSDAALRERFFSRLQLIYYGGAVLPEHVWAGIDEVAVQAIGRRILIVSGIGSTEAGPVPTSTNWDPRRKAIVGLPVPGVEVKITPVGNKLELRLRGPCMTPGYWKDPERTRVAFDEEGYFCLGDAVRFVDPEHPEKGLKYDGRISENFKLQTGTWVSVAEVRERAIAAFAPYARDVVIAGHDREYVSAIVFPEIDACRTLDTALATNADAAAVVASPKVRSQFQAMLDALAARSTGSSNRIARVVLEVDPPTLDTGELTAKSAISQASVLARRANVVSELYAAEPSPRTLRAADGNVNRPSADDARPR